MTGRRTLSYPHADAGDVPDHLRCRKNDGKKWRCPMRALDGLTICDYHHNRQKRNYANRQNALVLSLPKGPPDPSDFPAKKRRRRNRAVAGEEDDAVLALAAAEGGDERRLLPNGVMTISQGPARVWEEDLGPIVVDRKLGFDEGVIWRRCVRSKNVEPVPVGPVKRFPVCGKKVVKKKKRRRRRCCHGCGVKDVSKTDRCRKCRKVYFCSSCVSKWYQQMFDLKAKSGCPVCCGLCNCETCILARAENGTTEDIHNIEDVVDKIKHDAFPVSQQLSEQEQNIQYELNELEIEAVDQGRRSSYIQLQVTERAIVNCNNCKTLLGGFHRSCSKCSYKLCLNCSGKLRKGHMPELVENGKSSKATKACKNNSKENGVAQMPYIDPNYSSFASFESKYNNSRSSISCPTKRLGGCSDGILRLMFMMPFGRSMERNHFEQGFV